MLLTPLWSRSQGYGAMIILPLANLLLLLWTVRCRLQELPSCSRPTPCSDQEQPRSHPDSVCECLISCKLAQLLCTPLALSRHLSGSQTGQLLMNGVIYSDQSVYPLSAALRKDRACAHMRGVIRKTSFCAIQAAHFKCLQVAQTSHLFLFFFPLPNPWV